MIAVSFNRQCTIISFSHLNGNRVGSDIPNVGQNLSVPNGIIDLAALSFIGSDGLVIGEVANYGSIADKKIHVRVSTKGEKVIDRPSQG